MHHHQTNLTGNSEGSPVLEVNMKHGTMKFTNRAERIIIKLTKLQDLVLINYY